MTAEVALGNLLAWSAQAALVVASALLTIAAVRLSSPSVRYLFLRLALVVCLALPFVQPRHAAQSSVAANEVSVQSAVDAAATDQPEWSAAAFIPAHWIAILLLTGAAARALWIVAGVLRLRRLRHAGQPAGGDEHEDLQRVIGTRPMMRYVPELRQPVTFGARRPVVLLPDELRAAAPSVQRAVIAHELWHVRRGDWLSTVAEELLRAFVWFHLPVWLLISRIQAAREELVDELAILTTGSRRSYVDALLVFADETPPFAASAFARRAHLVKRIVLISKEAVMSGRRVVACGAVMAIVLAGTSWLAAGAFPLRAMAAGQSLSASPGPQESAARKVTPENPVPRRLRHANADYPDEAQRVGARGYVKLRITLDQSGAVAETRLSELSLRFQRDVSFSFLNGSNGNNGDFALEQALRSATFCCTPEGTRASFETFRPAIESMVEAAGRAASQWAYAPPAEAPLSFDVTLAFVPPGDTDMVFAPRQGGSAPARSEWGPARDTLRVGGEIKPPTRVHNVNAVYPPIAQSAGVQGVVIIEARIDTNGDVSDARVLRSIPLLDQAALEAVGQWKYEPTLLNGKAVPVIMTVTVNFTLAQ